VAYTGEHIRVQCFPMMLYIAALGVKTIDYFSLDIEGNEIDVLETIPFNEVDIKVWRILILHASVWRVRCGIIRDMFLILSEAERNNFCGTMITRCTFTFQALSVEYIHNAKGQKYLIDMMERQGYYVYSFVKHSDNLANDIIFVKRNTWRANMNR